MSRPAPIDRDEVLSRTRAWVRETFLYMRPDWPLEDGTSLLQRGVIDSIGVIELVEFLQESFGIRVAESEVTAANLGTLAAIAAFVDRKRGERDDEGPRAGAQHVA